MSVVRKRLRQRARELLPQMVEWRRRLHRWPELGFQEVRTSETVAHILDGYGVAVEREWAKTGVVGVLDGAGDGKTVALRAELDALPITEETGLSFASQNDGKMHACGHDGHMAALLGACALLDEIRNEWAGRVKFIFQPAEERLGGGRVMCDEGVLDNPAVESIYALHLWPWLPKGQIGFIDGAMMAALDEFEVEVIGKASHGASPHLGVDAVVAGARVVDALQHIVARAADPQDPAVITIGEIHGGTASNIVADRLRLVGSVRTFHPALREEMPKRVERIVAGVTAAHGAEYRLEWKSGYPTLINTPDAVARYERAARRILGEESAVRLERPSMASEDFAYYLQRTSGSFAFMGIGEGEDSPGLHTPNFAFDESVLADAAAVLAGAALETLEES